MLATTEKVHFSVGRSARKVINTGEIESRYILLPGRIPRISRWMALAICLLQRLEKGELINQAEIARAGKVSRARLSQIMSLNQLAPDLQEKLLFLPRILRGKDPIQMRHVIPITMAIDWNVQRTMFQQMRRV